MTLDLALDAKPATVHAFAQWLREAAGGLVMPDGLQPGPVTSLPEDGLVPGRTRSAKQPRR